MDDPVHVFLSAPPKVAPSIIAKVLKGSTARMLFTKHPELKMVLRHGHLWNPGYDVGSAGQGSCEIIQCYIHGQKTKKEGGD
jgi:putative transposase